MAENKPKYDLTITETLFENHKLIPELIKERKPILFQLNKSEICHAYEVITLKEKDKIDNNGNIQTFEPKTYLKCYQITFDAEYPCETMFGVYATHLHRQQQPKMPWATR
jgi:cytoplasmic iron level regulating protein YaaA (DUF328/UPF0246 family)